MLYFEAVEESLKNLKYMRHLLSAGQFLHDLNLAMNAMRTVIIFVLFIDAVLDMGRLEFLSFK